LLRSVGSPEGARHRTAQDVDTCLQEAPRPPQCGPGPRDTPGLKQLGFGGAGSSFHGKHACSHVQRPQLRSRTVAAVGAVVWAVVMVVVVVRVVLATAQ